MRRQAEREVLHRRGGGVRQTAAAILQAGHRGAAGIPSAGEEPSPAEIQKALQAEGAAIRERLPKGGAVVALCIEGKPCSSEELSRRMADFGVQGKTQITFLIGGSVGLSEDVKKLADWRLSMSPMTFPHHMARIMLLEQLYRAYQIAAGTKYHK